MHVKVLNVFRKRFFISPLCPTKIIWFLSSGKYQSRIDFNTFKKIKKQRNYKKGELKLRTFFNDTSLKAKWNIRKKRNSCKYVNCPESELLQKHFSISFHNNTTFVQQQKFPACIYINATFIQIKQKGSLPLFKLMQLLYRTSQKIRFFNDKRFQELHKMFPIHKKENKRFYPMCHI